MLELWSGGRRSARSHCRLALETEKRSGKRGAGSGERQQEAEGERERAAQREAGSGSESGSGKRTAGSYLPTYPSRARTVTPGRFTRTVIRRHSPVPVVPVAVGT